MPTLYEIIDDLRREHPTPSASRTLDMVVAELGATQDNLREALKRLEGRPVPTGGQQSLEELQSRALAAGVDDLHVPRPKEELEANMEPIDESQIGIAVLLGGTAAVAVILALVVVGIGLNQIFHFVS
jgi:hypothetical protein